MFASLARRPGSSSQAGRSSPDIRQLFPGFGQTPCAFGQVVEESGPLTIRLVVSQAPPPVAFPAMTR